MKRSRWPTKTKTSSQQWSLARRPSAYSATSAAWRKHRRTRPATACSKWSSALATRTRPRTTSRPRSRSCACRCLLPSTPTATPQPWSCPATRAASRSSGARATARKAAPNSRAPGSRVWIRVYAGQLSIQGWRTQGKSG